MYYNKRDKYGRFTKENKIYNKQIKKMAKTLPYNMSWTLIECVRNVRKDTKSFSELEKWYDDIMKHMKVLELPEYDTNKDLMPFFKAMFDFYGLAIEGTLVARELDRLAGEKKTKQEKKAGTKFTELSEDDCNDLPEVFKALLKALDIKEGDVKVYCTDLDTGECCKGRCKHKK